MAVRVAKPARKRFSECLPYAEDAQAVLKAASAQGRLPLGEEALANERRRCANVEGFSLHANTWMHPNDRQNPRREDGKLEYRLRKGVGESRYW